MPKVGEAWYELDARDARLVSALKGAEGRARVSGRGIEKAVGDGGEAGFGRGAVAAGKFGGALDQAHAKTGKFGGVLSNVSTGVLQGLGVAGFVGVTAAAGAFVAALGKGITAASDLQETVSKVGVVFGENAADIRAWAKDSDTAMGLSEQAALGAAATYGNLFVALKLPAPAAAEMSKSLVELAGDLASFNNVPVGDSLAALQSGLTGEFESLKRFGVNLNEATIAQKALELGLIKTTKDAITPAIKAQAIYAVVLDQTTTAQGDFARTSEGYANQQRIAAAQVENAFAEMGQAILPLAQQIVPMLARAMTGLVKVISWLLDNARPIGVLLGILGGVVATTVVPPFLAWAAATIAATWPLIAIGAAVAAVVFVLEELGVLGPIVSIAFGAIGAVFDAVGKQISNVFEVIKFVVGGIIGTVRNLMDIAASIPGPWQEGAAAVSATLSGMQKDVESWGKETVRDVGEHAAQIPGTMADPIKAGAGTVGDAAQAGIAAPVTSAATAAKAWAAREAAATPRAIADAIRGGQFTVKDAIDAIRDVQKTSLSKTKEIAKLEGFLTGKTLRKALQDGRPGVRAEAEAWKAAAEERLFALRNGVPAIALRTGQTYADALAQKRAEVASKTSQLAGAAARKLRDVENKAELWGQHAGRNWADGLASMRYYAARAAAEYASGARGSLEFTVPKEGPLRKMEEWGEHAGQSWARGLASQQRNVFRAAITLATGATALAPRSVATLAPGGSAAPAAAAGGPITLAPVYSPMLSTASPAELQRASRVLGDSLVRELAARGVLPATRVLG